ncbi:MAG TPA: GDSL-type esterase/lipase family protein [Acidobacteriaceae bacterium]|nr:GDSL-type esterase/lipase family protein [Acidobacteriaceae bacterium]
MKSPIENTKRFRFIPSGVFIVVVAAAFGFAVAASLRGVEPLSNSDSSPCPVEVADNSDSNVVVALGDSFTAGYGAPAGKSYPDYLEEYLNNSGYYYNVLNFGRNGASSGDGLKQVTAIEKKKPALVVVILGANDMLDGLPIAQTTANLSAIVSSLQRTGSKVILGELTLSKDYGAGYIQEFHAMFLSLAKQYNVPLDNDLYHDLTGIPGMLQDDQVHATAEGNAQVAQNVLPVVRPMLVKHRSRHKKKCP